MGRVLPLPVTHLFCPVCPEAGPLCGADAEPLAMGELPTRAQCLDCTHAAGKGDRCAVCGEDAR